MKNLHTLSLTDGRVLSYAEYGNPNGKPVLMMHGAPGSRLERTPNDEDVMGLDLRLIIPNRPGYGSSTVAPGRTFLSWADDVKELMDHLALPRCAMLGYSGGGPYAMACAVAIPERVTRLALISSIAPMDTPDATAGMTEQSRAMFALAKTDPATFAVQIKSLVPDGETLFHIMTAALPPEDKALFEDAAMHSMYLADMNEAVSSGVEGFVSDVLLYTAQWGFKPSQITRDILLWQGLQDINVPQGMGHRLAAEIPQCRATFVPDAAHYLFFARWREIFIELLV
jgi:pimeloyl-ACP methyl ester carboxylesterase